MLEIRTRITELLENVQSEATVVESGTRHSSTPLQAIIDDQPQNIATVALNEKLPDQEHGLFKFGVVASLPEDADPMICQRPPDVVPCNTPGHVSYELGAQPFLPQHDTCSEGETLPGSSSRLSQQLPLPIEEGTRDKV
ncbi:hypothetical protein EDD22DRAFT_952375 [Suillus occidentalis]|nr:hypothetical protein EDD22DRAFT_952375 [Suillus occidentalis]